MERNPNLPENRPQRIRTYHAVKEHIPAPKSQREQDAKKLFENTLAEEEAKASEKLERQQHATSPFTLAFRDVAHSDFHFVLNAWMMSYRDSNRHLKNDEYFRGQQNLIAEIANRRNCLLAVDRDVPDYIIGFAAGISLSDGRFLLDYVYVKHAYRERGIARSLLEQMGVTHETAIVCTHRNKPVQPTMNKYRIEYNPYFNTIGFSDV